MEKQLKIWKFIYNNLEKEVATILLYVLESIGSSPGRRGFFMAVNEVEQMEGSIGGGIMEHKFVEMAKQILKENAATTLVKKQVHDKKAGNNKSGMICSGEQTILVYPLQVQDRKPIQQIISILKNNSIGTISFSPQGINFSESENEDNQYQFNSEEDWHYTEKIGYQNHLYIIGGGHCALALSNLMRSMDFYIHLFDDRKDLNTWENNHSAHQKKYISSYTQIDQYIPSGENNYVVIMTFGYRSDDEALRALIHKEFKYLGVMGSKKKIQKMFETYQAENIPIETLQKIHAPIGIPIHSQSTEEIAVSIAAEIIGIKNIPQT
ncbi:MAG: XdhC family protein [Ginsengibacter sp.]|jgi:xanthine dehydrogenase accessory factor